MREYIEKLCVILLLAFVCCNTEATFENKGYGVSVSFSLNVPPEDGKVILNHMRESLTDASEILHAATGLGFSKVVFKIPISWDTSEWNMTVEKSLNLGSSKSEFLIDHTNDVVFGKLPFAQQYGGCGLPGRQITVPTAFFDEANTFPKGISLAREWIKYRYGVFDENGYFEDPQYPLYYTIPGSDTEVKITDCTNEQVTYNFLEQNGEDCSTSEVKLTDRLNSKECRIKPDENTENITSSMMYFQKDIHTLLHVCGKDSGHTHNSRAPNKQNALCDGQSIWDVVKKSSDFQKEENNEEYMETAFVYIQEAKPKVVVAWENTAHLKSKELVILNAIKQFVIDLPTGSKFNGFPFKTDVPPTRKYNLNDLNELEDKNRIIGDTVSDFVKSETGDINIAISKALEIFSSAAEEEGTIIIITKSIQAANEDILQKLKESKLCIAFILFTEDDIPADTMAEITHYRSASNCTTVKEILTTAVDEDAYRELLEDMETLLPSYEDKTTETAKVAYLSEGSPISLHVSQSVETVMFTVFSRREGENFVLEFNEEKQENAFEEKNIGDVLVLSFSPTQAGDIKFDYPHEAPAVLTHIRITSKKGKYFSGEIFISDTSVEESVQMPVIIYAVVRYGAYPVQNAKVFATIERPNEKEITFELNDDGKGNPDITQNDGVYSRYFTGFTEKGMYMVTVTVENNGGLTTFGANKNTGYESCCGSYVNGDTYFLSEFTKILKSSFAAKSGRPDDGYKPLRISDLRIDKVVDNKIILKWTAPGEEADHGTASRYEIKIFCGEENVTVCDTHKMVRVINKPPPLNYGKEQQVTIQILTNTKILSMGIITVNENNKESDLSNTIEIFRPTDKPLEVTTREPEHLTKQGSAVGTIIAIVIPWIIVITCIIGAIIYYFKRKSHGKKPGLYEIEENINNRELKSTFQDTNYNIKSAPIKKFESLPVLLYTHNQIKDFKDKDKDPPLYKADAPSTTWKSLDIISNIKNEEDDRDAEILDNSNNVHATTDDLEVNIQH